MNNLAYTSQDPAYVGEKVEEKVREEIGAGLGASAELMALADLIIGSSFD